MYKSADAEGRYPVSHEEYQAFRALFGSQNSLLRAYKTLEKRAKTVPGAWRDLKMMLSVMEKLLTNLLKTVPSQKLLSMKRELKDTICEVKLKGVSGSTNDDLLRVVPQGALEHVIDKAMAYECFACERCDYKRCKLYQSIDSMFHYDFPKTKICPLSGDAELFGEAQNVE